MHGFMTAGLKLNCLPITVNSAVHFVVPTTSMFITCSVPIFRTFEIKFVVCGIVFGLYIFATYICFINSFI